MAKKLSLAFVLCGFFLGLLLLDSSALCSSSFAGWEYASSHPVEYYGASAVVVNQTVFVLGNSYNPEYFSSVPLFDRVWTLDLETLRWSWKPTFGDIPERRVFYCAREIKGKLYLLAGKFASNNQKTNTMSVLDLESLVWSKVIYSSIEKPGERNFQSCTSHGDTIYMYGGILTSELYDLWAYSTTSKEWKAIVPLDKDSDKIPISYNPYIFAYRDTLIFYGGIEKSTYQTLTAYKINSVFWRYDLKNETWISPLEVKGAYPAVFGTSLVIENRFYLFSGAVDSGWKTYSNTLTIINLDTIEVEVVKVSNPDFKAYYPIVSPAPRMHTQSVYVENKFIVLGGGFNCHFNDYWIFDIDRKTWINGSLSVYPLGRENPHTTILSDTEMAVFGGDIYHSVKQPINDLWILNTEKYAWKRISQESVCSPDRYDCAPAVKNAAFGYWNQSLFVLGGFYEGFKLPIMRQFDIVSGIWNHIPSLTEGFKSVGLRSSSANIVIGSKIFVWGGRSSDSSAVQPFIYIFDMKDKNITVNANGLNAPVVKSTRKGIVINNTFCFVDTLNKDSMSSRKEIWCFYEDENKWLKRGALLLATPDYSLVAHRSNIITFGDSSLSKAKAMWIGNDMSSYWKLITFENQMAPGRGFTWMTTQSNTLIVFGGRTDFITTNGIYTLDLSSLFCRGTKYISGNNTSLTDGSEDFNYFPGTNCLWVIRDTNFLVVEYVNITVGAYLKLYQDDCGEGFIFNGRIHKELFLGSVRKGDVIKAISGEMYVSFFVEKAAQTSEGFSLKLFECDLGFTARDSGCICESGRYINFRSECIPCSEGYLQPYENQRECNLAKSRISISDDKFDTSQIQQTQSVLLSHGIPPVVFGNAVVVNSTIYLVGGSTSTYVELDNFYHPMDIVYTTQSPVNSIWKAMKMLGDIPSSRVHGCLISMESFAVLIGGKTREPDSHIYFLGPKEMSWVRKSKFPRVVIGAQCERKNDSIYIFGGEDEYGLVAVDIYEYSTSSDTTKRIQFSGPSAARSFGLMIYISDKFLLFGGTDGRVEPESMLSYDSDCTLEFNFHGISEAFHQECTICEEEGGECLYGRKQFAYSIHENEIHIYGGKRKRESIADIIVINTDSSKILHRENYGLSLPDLPLTTPPPKYGAAFVTHDSKFMVIGGATSANNVVNDVWTWDTALRTWIDTSILREPVNRNEPGFSKFNESSFITFGGATQYISEVLLNDLWTFNLAERSWSCLFPGSLDVGPKPRAGAVVAYHSNRVFIAGGRTDNGVTDGNVWSFDFGTKNWVIEVVRNNLLLFQRPLNRYGVRFTRAANKIWLWGGQIMPGARKVEFYSAVIGIDYENEEIFSNKIIGKAPPRRTYHSMCSIDDQRISIYGGNDVNGNVLNDHWTYNMKTQTWNETNYDSSADPLGISNHICSTFEGFTLISGASLANSESITLMLQNDFEKRAVAYRSNQIHGYEGISRHAGEEFDGLLVSFGGSSRYSTTNQVVAYRPGFCSSTPKYFWSTFEGTDFDDGSGSGMYLENTNCTWILPNATHIVVSYRIRSLDRIDIYPFDDRATVENSALSPEKSYGNEALFSSPSGFTITFTAAVTKKETENKPCDGCEGFSIYHSSCPLNSAFDFAIKKCVCKKDHIYQDGQCNKGSMPEGINHMAIIVGIVSGTVFIAILIGFFYRKKIVKNMEGAEKKLYGFIDPRELSFGVLIGKGSFGEVYKGEWRGTEVAIKILDQNKLRAEQIEAFKREIGIMVELRHPNIILYMGACLEREKMSLVCELMHQGSLYDVLHSEKQITYRQSLQFMSDISKGMQYLHMSSPPILHRDLKSLNILVDDRSRLKVSDFGLTTFQGLDKSDSVTGTLLWLAPEVIGGEEYKQAADVYSFGIIAWEIMSRKDPFYEIENVFVVTAQVYISGLRPTMPPHAPKEIQDLINQLWDQIPQQRPTFQEASKMIYKLMEVSKNDSNSSFTAVMGNEESPPEGNVCVVSSRIFGSERLWDDVPESMGDALFLHNSIIKACSKRYHGYISLSEGGKCLIIFQDPVEAVRFCSEVQIMMNEAEWPSNILEHKDSKLILEADLRGLRIQMGLDVGICQMKIDESSKNVLYSGKCVSTVIKLCRASLGGQILMTEVTYQVLGENIGKIEKDNVFNLVKRESNGKELIIYQVYPKKLGNRAEFHSKLQRILPNTMSSSEFYDDNSKITHNLPHTTLQSLKSTSANSSNHPGTCESTTHIHSSVHSPNRIMLEPLSFKRKEKVEWEVPFDEIKLGDTEIGSGSFGAVFAGEYKGQKVAVKKIIRSKGKALEKNHILFLTEVSVIRKLNHTNVVEFIGACTTLPNLAILMEFVEPGNLREVLKNHSIIISLKDKCKITAGIIDGMKYLHSLNPAILHRDLKSANVLVNHSFESKICDFGFARVKANNRTMTKCGTVAYQAPEVMKGERYNEKADVYSFGILLWEIEMRETPYEGKDPLTLQFEVLNGLRPPTQGKSDQAMIQQMKKCWNESPELRPSFEELSMQHQHMFNHS